jgi:Icc-related predicted phosphoesterase
MLPNLKIHISGHIHESYGIVKKGNVINVCASILNEEYQITNQPITVEV